MNPLFEVGEEVILCSKNRPELNGDAIVELVFISPFERQMHLYKNGINLSVTDSTVYYPAYVLDVSPELRNKNLETINGQKTLFAQSALRKKHKPSTKSFKELIGLGVPV